MMLNKKILLGMVGAVALSFACTKKAELDSSNTFYTYSIAKIKGLDPIFADDLYAGTEVMRVYEGLLEYHYLKRPYTLEPALAAEMPKISADGKTYTFKLKPGSLFADDACFPNGKGREVTADDVVYSLKRLADPKLNSPMWWLLDGKIVGLNEWHDAQAKADKVDYAKEVAGLKAVDKYTVQIALKQRSYQFVYAFAMPAAGIVAKEAVEKYGPEFLNHPVGTGAFKVAEYNPTQKIVYVRNPTHRPDVYPSEGEAGDKEKGLLADAGKPVPFVDKIVMTIYQESQPQWLTFMQGKLDLTSIPKDNFAQAMPDGKELAKDLKDKGAQLFVAPSLDITHTSFNMVDPVVGKNKYLRQAISTALNDAEFIQIFYNGRALSAQGPIPPGLEGYDPNLKNPYKQYSVEKAKELLKKAGFEGGKGLAPLEYVTLSDSTTRQQTEWFQKQMAAIGIQLKVQTYSWPEFQNSVKNKRGQIWSFAWGADYPDAENFLQLFYSKNSSPGPNDANYNSPEFDKLYEKALTLPDGAERTALYKKMAALVVEETPWAFGAHRLSYGLAHKWVKNYKPHEFNHGMSKYYRVDTSARR